MSESLDLNTVESAARIGGRGASPEVTVYLIEELGRVRDALQRAGATLQWLAKPHGHVDPHRSCCEIARRAEDMARATLEDING